MHAQINKVTQESHNLSIEAFRFTFYTNQMMTVTPPKMHGKLSNAYIYLLIKIILSLALRSSRSNECVRVSLYAKMNVINMLPVSVHVLANLGRLSYIRFYIASMQRPKCLNINLA